MSKEDFDKQAKKAMGREVKRLQSFYRFLKDKVRNVKLNNGFHYVVMPFFKPVPKFDRCSVLKDVEEVYRNRFMLAENEERYIYNDRDVRWMHIGSYDAEEEGDNDGPPSHSSNGVTIAREMTTHYILFDLADLILLDSAMTETEYDELQQGTRTHGSLEVANGWRVRSNRGGLCILPAFFSGGRWHGSDPFQIPKKRMSMQHTW
jgi:hypothetical protein